MVEKMERIIVTIGFFILVLAVIPVYAQSTLALQEKCAEGAKKLIEDSKEKISSGIPLLSKIPILGGLFGFQSYEKKRTELIILMTPHIISDQIQSKSVTEEFKEKLEGIRKELGEKIKK